MVIHHKDKDYPPFPKKHIPLLTKNITSFSSPLSFHHKRISGNIDNVVVMSFLLFTFVVNQNNLIFCAINSSHENQ